MKYNTYAILDKFAYSWYSIHFPFASWIHEILNDFVSLNAILKQFDLTKQNCRDKKTHVKSFLSFNVHYLGCYEPFLSNKRKFSKLHIFCILNFLHWCYTQIHTISKPCFAPLGCYAMLCCTMLFSFRALSVQSTVALGW